MRVTLIVNPFASSVTHRTRVRIQQLLAADHELTVVETTKGGHAIRLAHGAAKAWAEVIVALGGDGTINEVANGLLDDGPADDRAAIVPLPGGSTNVFARALGYPNDPLEATSVLVEALNRRSTMLASVGMANGRAFLFHAGAGFDAAVVQRVEERGPLKRYVGHPLFVASTVATWLRDVDRRRPWFSIETDDGRRVADAQLAVTLNCNPYTYLGARPLDLAPEADLTTPLSIVALRSLAMHRLLPVATEALRGGDAGLADGGSIRHWDEVFGATLVGYRDFPYQLDGEAMEPVPELRLQHRPRAVKLVVPHREPDQLPAPT
ncbi:MAG: diacylglycerol/lipid kinase family protein [Acidimicrobiales bacterium]